MQLKQALSSSRGSLSVLWAVVRWTHSWGQCLRPPHNVPSSSEKSPVKLTIQQKLFRVCLPLASLTEHVLAPAKHLVEVNQKDPPPASRDMDQKDPALRGRR